ncbi:(deoxy)nucleoside triphosphate pyrophosphohydrolase [Amycolatopsis anabasis]|uniref:(deoxy)nucleoside triphosphate pyrophosphohydrolase n=1 Tax=Amycolatopsis anabasis TaxID=1840409 RepID=UPI00131D7468|nr:NUDIX domain-containing protein [Amycolatopsis anabasis]
MIVGAAIVREGALLAQQRAWPDDAAGRWELPGGRVEPEESEVDALRRECAEELDVDVLVGDRVGPDVALPGGKVLRIFAAELKSGEPRAVEHRAVRWLAAGQLGEVDWLPADRELLPELANLLARP